MELTEINVAEFATDELLEKAAAIRDAVKAKSVTAEQVGTMFIELITACGSVRDALALFLDTNVGEILDGIDERLSSGVSDSVEEISEDELDSLLEDFEFLDGVVTEVSAEGDGTFLSLTAQQSEGKVKISGEVGLEEIITEDLEGLFD